MKFYLIAGEASGDARGAELMRALRERVPEARFTGAGGPAMCGLTTGMFDWAHEAVVGVWDVLRKYGYFRQQFHRMLAELEGHRPDALVLIDYPGFNLRFAAAARRRIPGLKIIFYVSPQVWAWHRGRIPKMARTLDLMLCIFPFEQPLYEASGLRTVFVGHPLLDALAPKIMGFERDPTLVALLPGSRQREVRRIFPIMLAAARRLPGRRFEAAAADERLAGMMLAMVEEAGVECEILDRGAHELMQRAAAGMVASGTATLEAAYFRMPLVILYRVAWLTWVIGKRLVRVPFLGMPNLLAGREIAREFLQGGAQPELIAEEVTRLLTDTAAREVQRTGFDEVIAGLGRPGAGARAAEAICTLLRP